MSIQSNGQKRTWSTYQNLGDSFALVGLGFALFYWTFDALIRYVEFPHLNWEFLFIGTKLDVLTKVLAVTLFILFSSYIKISLNKRHTKEMELQKSEEKYRSILVAMKDSAYICSPDRQIEYLNPAMKRRIGNHDATGRLCHEAIYSRNTPCPWCCFDQVKKGKNIDYELNDPNDTSTFYSVANAPIVNPDGSVSKLTIFRDISNLKKMEKQIFHSQKMETIGALAGGIAHDFNNILFPIIGHSELMLMDMEEDNPFRSNIKEIQCGALRAKDLIHQILSFSRKESGELKRMQIQPILREAVILIRSTIPKTISINQAISPDCGMIKADPTQIHQLIMNLITNAYHAMEKTGGELTISLNEIALGRTDLVNPDMDEGIYAYLTVSDTGAGMTHELMQKIFNPFFTTKKKEKGTGLGLSVVDSIVKSIGGFLKVDSEPGKGTTFYVYLPIAPPLPEDEVFQPGRDILADDGASSVPEPSGDPEPGQKTIHRILLVDDEALVITMEEQMLRRLGYQVCSFLNSVDALRAFRSNPEAYDLVITDMAMPNMGGDVLASELKIIRPGIPVLLCSGYSENLTPSMINEIGIDALLMKPILMEDLDLKIHEILDEGQAAMAN